MTKEMVAQVDKEELSSEHITFTPYGVEFTEDERPTIEEWHKAVLKVQNVHGMLQFYLGDLIVFADSPVTGWGDSKYQALIDNTGYSYDSARKFAKVARRFPLSFREEVLKDVSSTTQVSFTHFDEVSSLDDEHALYFLGMVRDGRWTVSKLREEIARYKNNGQLPDVEADSETPVGYETFKNFTKQFFRGFMPDADREYDEQSWLLEVHGAIEERLHELGIEL